MGAPSSLARYPVRAPWPLTARDEKERRRSRPTGGRVRTFAGICLVLCASACSSQSESAVVRSVTRDNPPPRVAVEVDRDVARAGAKISARVIAPDWVVYGIDAVLERRVRDGVWAPTHHLAFALPVTGSKPRSAPYNDPRWAVRLVGLRGSEWRALVLPADVRPGQYRIAKKIGDKLRYAPIRIIS